VEKHIMRAIWVSAAILLLPGLALAQQGRYNPAVVGNPSYTGYGAPPPTYIPGALHNPSYTGYNAPRYGTGFNPSYTGYNYQPYGTSLYYGPGEFTSPYTYGPYRYNGEGRATQSVLYGTQSAVRPDVVAGLETPPEDRLPQAVTLEVKVPNPAAEVFIEGGRTRSVGLDRTFVSPKLEPGTRYTYEVKARWTDNGKEVEQTRRVPVHAGERVTVDFTKPEK
jgi:uncharacterized protein (TIGR03000 family)